MQKKEKDVVIGVLALQGAFSEHQKCLERGTNCKTVQIRKASQLEDIDGIIFPGGESTAMGLIGGYDNIWDSLKEFVQTGKPVWGTCAGMILLADRCVGGSAVIENGQSLIGGVDILVCRNYFGSQVSSFEMETPCPPGFEDDGPFPGVFIRAPAILTVGDEVDILGKVIATPCRQAAVVLSELERKIEANEDVIMMNVVDALERKSGQDIKYKNVTKEVDEDNKNDSKIELPGAADGTNAREVICAARKKQVLVTSFHPELINDDRWHQYFHKMVVDHLQDS